jgi:hypothetical protein
LLGALGKVQGNVARMLAQVRVCAGLVTAPAAATAMSSAICALSESSECEEFAVTSDDRCVKAAIHIPGILRVCTTARMITGSQQARPALATCKLDATTTTTIPRTTRGA